ncbi:hypothetical protein V2J09_013179 [Rumex salicifolius]
MWVSKTSFERKAKLRKEEHMLQKRPPKSSSSSYTESIKALEADIHHANSLATALPKDYCGDCVQMRLSYSPLAPFFLYLIQWMDYSCTDALPTFLGLLHVLVYKVYIDGMPTMSFKERKASLREFYAVIYPSLNQLEGDIIALRESSMKRGEEKIKFSEKNIERDEECGICMEHCTQMILPNCVHSMNARSRSCPFCRGSLKRVSSKDLWVLTSKIDVVDPITIARENVSRFYLYMDSLPLVTPDPNALLFGYMI